MDAFFASVEQMDAPELKGKCVIVGGDSDRGVVTSASYEARKYGIHAAMPIFQAKEKCPNGIIVPGRMDRYKALSKEIMGVLESFTPLVEQVSIDEAYMDITGCEKLYGTPNEIAARIKEGIAESVGLTCSVGIAPTKFLAKIASDFNKPNGLTVINTEDVDGFIESLPIRKVPGVGKSMHEKLDRIGIRTLGDVKKTPAKTLEKRLGKSGHRLSALSQNIDPSTISASATAKSVSSETTLLENTRDRTILRRYLLWQSESVGRQLRKGQFRAKTITLKLKHEDFKRITRNRTLDLPTQSSETIYRAAKSLLASYRIAKPVRLVGVGASGLISEATPTQMTLFQGHPSADEDWERVDAAVDTITDKFGKHAIKKASLHPTQD